MEKVPKTDLFFSDFIDFLVLEPALVLLTRFRKLASSHLSVFSWSWRTQSAEKISRRKEEVRAELHVNQAIMVTGEDMELVMEKLGFGIIDKAEKRNELLRSDDISAMFEEEEPSLEEAVEAFGFFDENRDGFVDAEELQRVLFKLGFGGVELDSCKTMIAAHDDNGDGVIDFCEFLKLSESSFS
ncbi:probable calcium-binding protein CML30 [Dendrobium catenatum]|uniref:Putative calcium-binding protein CML30 n=1 Tax=Dendrobium catenatum TaxID=906689 RepID=A0A2I0WDW6_9ASPA|nr:probable calcium-binding protein CML30 [Dendrobium catenatum]PKU73853.1 putative calcium-binding protein CML30 [Dendrobium catenatum]